MRYRTVSFSIPHQPTVTNFAKPNCKIAHYFCLLARKNNLSFTDILIIQDIGFVVKFSSE